MSEPQVKGSMLQPVFSELRQMCRTGALSEDRVSTSLSMEAAALLDVAPIHIGWYPVAIYREALDLYWELGAQCKPEFLLSGGAEVARALFSDSAYRSFFAASQRARAASVESLLGRFRLMVHLNSVFYDFIDLRIEHDEAEDTIRLIYDNAAPFSHAMFIATHGCLNGFATLAFDLADGENPEAQWVAERPTPDRMIFAHRLSAFLDRTQASDD